MDINEWALDINFESSLAGRFMNVVLVETVYCPNIPTKTMSENKISEFMYGKVLTPRADSDIGH